MPHELTVAVQPGSAVSAVRTPPMELSASVNEIMGRTPSWLLRSGMNVIGGLTLLLLIVAAIVRYPDTITGRVTVTGTNPPVAIVARQSGHLERLEVREKQEVKRGGLLAVIRSPVDCERVFQIKAAMNALQPSLSDPQAKSQITLPEGSGLGTLQGAYSELTIAWRQHALLLADDFADKTIALLNEQMDRKRAQVEQMRQQVRNAEREHEIAQQRYNRLKELQKRDSLSLADLQEAERVLLEHDRQHGTIRGTFMDEEIAASDYEKQIEALRHTRRDDLRKSHQALSEAARKLLAAIDLWEADYVLRAPVDGTVGFYDFWSDQQFVTAGKEVFIIAPSVSPLLGRVPVQALGAGKLKPGQSVRIRFDDYPYREFGIVTGRLENVSLVAQKGSHLVSVHLESPLATNYGRKLPFKQEMMGDASIVVEERSLLGRIFGGMRDAFINRSAK